MNITNAPAVANSVVRYRELAQPAAERDGETMAAPLPAASEPHRRAPYPRPRLTRRWRKAIALSLGALLVGGYAAMCVIEQGAFCDAGNPVDVSSVVGSAVDPTLNLARESNGECVGLTTSATEFGYGARANPTDPTEVKDLKEIAELSRLIYLQNKEVDEIVAGGDQHSVTVVVATMLSTEDTQPYRDLTAGVNELRGAYLAQRQWNQINDSKLWPAFFVRLALANIGGDSAYAMQTAAEIKSYAQQDPSVIAVTGMGQTRDETLNAASMLGTPNGSWQGIPVVTTAPTGDPFADKRDVFMTAPTNARQAQVAATFIRSRTDLKNRNTFLVYDSSDPYSLNLETDYVSALHAKSLTVRRAEAYNTAPTEVNNRLNVIGHDICGEPGNPLVVYVGRANEFPTMASDLSCSPNAVLVGDDDLTQTEAENYNDLIQLGLQSQIDGRVYYTSFAGACPDLLIAENAACGVKNNFTSIYMREVNKEKANHDSAAFRTGWNGEIMLAYDGITLVLNATDPVHRDRQDLQKELQGTMSTGIAGPIHFAPRPLPGGVDPHKQVVVEEIRTQPGNSNNLMPQIVYPVSGP